MIDPNIKNISNRISPNYSTWNTIELSYQFAKMMIEENIEGDFVECGIAAGNNLAAMCLAGRHGFGFDSFEGIPWAGEHDTEQPGMDSKTKNSGLESSGISSHSLEDVIKNFHNWKIFNATFIKGWFQETIPNHENLSQIENISVLRLDGDLYESTLIPLQYLYPMLSKGGILIMDDWQLTGARKAFQDYFHLDDVPEVIYEHSGVKYFRKNV